MMPMTIISTTSNRCGARCARPSRQSKAVATAIISAATSTNHATPAVTRRVVIT